MFEGTGMKKDDSVQGLVGWEQHGHPPVGEIPDLKIVGQGTAWRGKEEKNLYCHYLSRSAGEFCFQCRDHFLVSGSVQPARAQIARYSAKAIVGSR